MSDTAEKNGAIQHIVRYGDKCLRRAAQKIKKPGKDTQALAQQLEEAMRAANGVGIAAPQLGVGKRIAIVDVGEGPIVLVNPRILKAEGESTSTEGCLSVPGLYGDVTRAAKVTVAAEDLSGKTRKITAEGLLARALQHEIDHLNGKLFIDRVDESTLHWLIRPEKSPDSDEEPEPVAQPTTLEDALRVFESRTDK